MTPPVAMVVAVPDATSISGASPQAITSALSVSRFGALSLGADGVGRTQREAVDIGAIEWRRVDRGDHVMREYTHERSRQRHRLGRKRLEIEMPLEARARFLGGNNFEELFLLRSRAHARDEIGLRARLHLGLLAHGQALTATLVPAG